MRLLAFGMTHFKSFHGDHTITLPDRGIARPVYLFGGLNGSGKTTLAQAIVLALYGERAAGLPGVFEPGRGTRDRYHLWLEAAFNLTARELGIDQMKAWVRLSDGSGPIMVTRSWWFDAAGNFVEEQLEVRDDTAGQTELAIGEEAQALVEQVLPRHLLDFAMFDGERVRKLDDTLSATAVRSALDRLLDLDAVERTRTEIARLARQRRLSHTDGEQLAIYHNVHEQLTLQTDKRTALADALRHHEDTQSRLQRELDQLTTTFDSVLSTAATPGQLTSDLIGLRERRSALRSRLVRQLGDWLYMLPALDLLPELASELATQLEQRTGRERKKFELEAIEDLVDRLSADSSFKHTVGTLPISQFHEWLECAVHERRNDLDAATNAEGDSLGLFSDAELAEVSAAISITQRDLADVTESAVDLLRVEGRIREMESLLAALDSNSTATNLLRRRDELNMLLGEQRAASDAIRTQLAEHDTVLSSLRTQLSTIEARLTVVDDQSWLETADATVAALDDFLAEARAEASHAVQQRMLVNLRTLLRKDNLVTDVVIDPETHVTRLMGRDGNNVELPSAAEHQLAAMAFIDAVLAAANNPIPIFVDTPLARLDSHHRRAVVRDFWPDLGRQVIVFSTDEEIIGDLLVFAEPATAATYHIECDALGASSVTIDEYLEAAAAS